MNDLNVNVDTHERLLEGTAAADWLTLTAASLAWIGTAICFLLVQMHASGTSIFCNSTSNCEAVLSSQYSTMFGIPLPWLGLTFYVVVLILLLTAYGIGSVRGARILEAVSWLALAGLSFSSTLMFIQFVLLRGFCPLCTSSAVVMLALFITVWKVGRTGAAHKLRGSASTALVLALFALVAGFAAGMWSVRPTDVIATVDSEELTRSQMEDELKRKVSPLRQRISDMEAEWLSDKLEQTLLAKEAKRLNQSVETLLATQIDSRIEVTEEEVTARLNSRHLANIKANIEAVTGDLVSDKRKQLRRELLARLMKEYRVEIRPTKSSSLFLNIDLATAHVDGPADARVKLVVFSDFQCPACAKLAPELRKIRKEYPKDVLVAFRHFPMTTHERAYSAALFSECAAEQGAFWQYHDKVFSEGGDLSDAKLMALAVQLGLDQPRFKSCLDSERPKKAVDASYQDAVAYRLPGTPSLFLNGTMIGGAIDYRTLVKEVTRELRKDSSSQGK